MSARPNNSADHLGEVSHFQAAAATTGPYFLVRLFYFSIPFQEKTTTTTTKE
jgi:hypothetical protein